VDQHVISRWLLKAFARGAPVLAAYVKTTGDYTTVETKTFMTEVDAHSTSIEQGIAAIETPASQAALTLAKRAKQLPAGLYAVASGAQASNGGSPGLVDKGVYEGMRLFVGEREIPSPKQHERLALARYAGLMYQRAPRMEEAMLAWGRAFDIASQRALDRILPGFHAAAQTELAHRRLRMLTMASNIGDRLANAPWWLVVAQPDEAFILGDSPVATTISLGHLDEWRAILAPESYVVAMPLSDRIAVLIAPQALMPVSGIEADLAGLVRAINRLLWRRAGSYVLARDESHLRAVWDEDSAARISDEITTDARYGAEQGWRLGLSVGVEFVHRRTYIEGWHRWEGCTPVFGWYPWPAEHRQEFIPPRRR
jgi:hypothetical protein